MKSTELQRRVALTETTALQGPPAPITEQTETKKVLQTSDQTISPGLTRNAPTQEQQNTLPESSALSIFTEQKNEGPHRRGRTAALRVQDVKLDFTASQRKAFKPLVDLIPTLHDLVEQLKVKP